MGLPDNPPFSFFFFVSNKFSLFRSVVFVKIRPSILCCWANSIILPIYESSISGEILSKKDFLKLLFSLMLFIFDNNSFKDSGL